jgi:4-amino-4-deoxy-L-arabinose transferase-like glycosyltransferase
LIGVLACAVFFGFLGSVDLWGKREQRAAVEAIDTIDNNHWLVAQLQGRPRLEKPPLLRWSIGAVLWLTGRRDEWMVRFPSAICGLATVWLVLALGRRIAGKSVGRAAALVLCSTGFFVAEMRQATSDAPLALFTTLALYAAWRRLHDEDSSAREFTIKPHLLTGDAAGPPLMGSGHQGPEGGGSQAGTAAASSSLWSLVFYGALGLGFLSKGPVILLLVLVALVPYLVFSGRLVWGTRRLAHGWGLSLFVILACGWPILVLRADPQALRVWLLEMAEKTGLSRVLEHRRHSTLPGQWPALVLPWTLIAGCALALPFFSGSPALRPGRDRDGLRTRGGWVSPLWFAWWWAIGNLAILSVWQVAKPSYYLPCLPAMALLTGAAWVQLARAAREQTRVGASARAILQAQWVLLFVAAAAAPACARPWISWPTWLWTVASAFALVASVAWSVKAWRLGADDLAAAPITTAFVLVILIAYGWIAPAENSQRGHRGLAQAVHRLVSPGTRRVMFFNEIDEGLWFYLNDLELAPVPGTNPKYNTAYDLATSYLAANSSSLTLSDLEAKRQLHEKESLMTWLDHADRSTSYLIIRKNLLDRYAADLAGRVAFLLSESRMKRNELVLLQVVGRDPIAARSDEPIRR